MKKIVRLTESDLIRIVKRVIKEGESENIYEKLVNKLKQNGFKSTDRENWETTVKNNMSVEVQFSGGYDIYAMVIVDDKGYARRPKGTLYDSEIVDQAIEIANMINNGVDKNTIKKHFKQKGFTGEPS